MPTDPTLIPATEAERLAALREYRVLDTPPERCFDDLAQLASRLCEVPIAAVSLIDAQRQWFKARIGFDFEEVPREAAFCAHAILGPDLLMVPDAAHDERFAQTPLVTFDPCVRFYAGAPLVSPQGHAVGTLCIMGRVPRRLAPWQAESLAALARQVVAQLERRRGAAELALVVRERDLADSERDHVFDHSLNLLGLIDAAGRMRQLNPMWVRALGFTSQELMSQPFVEFLHLDDRQRAATELERLGHGSEAVPFSARVLCSGGGYRHVVWNATFVPKFQGIYLTGQDVTSLVEVQDELRMSYDATRVLFENKLTGIITSNEELIIELVNDTAARMWGYEREELVGRHLSQLVPELADLHSNPVELEQQRDTALSSITGWLGRRKDGTLFPYELTLCAYESPSGRHFVGSVRDLSELREVERLKKEFVSTVSHELRTPLTSIRGSLGLLSAGAMGSLPGEAREVLAIAERNCMRLIALINDILDLERLGSGSLQLRIDSVPVAALLERSLEAVRGMAEEQGIQLGVRLAAARVRGDLDRLTQVMVNLISNAVKFSPRGNAVEITAEECHEHVEFTIEDHGRGIPAAHLPLLFERFTQVDASDSRQRGGTGLGLAICRAIVELHGGSIGVESQEKSGSRFWFRIPAVSNVDTLEPSCSLVQPPADPPTVLAAAVH